MNIKINVEIYYLQKLVIRHEEQYKGEKKQTDESSANVGTGCSDRTSAQSHAKDDH